MRFSRTTRSERRTTDTDWKDSKKAEAAADSMETTFSRCSSAAAEARSVAADDPAVHDAAKVVFRLPFILKIFLDIGHELRVQLEDLYNGKSKKLAIQRQVICCKCDGKGGQGAPTRCTVCKGTGMTGKRSLLSSSDKES